MNVSTGTPLLAHQVNISFSLGKEKGIHGGFRNKSVLAQEESSSSWLCNFLYGWLNFWKHPSLAVCEQHLPYYLITIFPVHQDTFYINIISFLLSNTEYILGEDRQFIFHFVGLLVFQYSVR